MATTKTSRRSLLQLLTVGAGSLQFGDLAKGPHLRNRVVHAATKGPPRRVVFMTHLYGYHEDQKWASWAQGGSSETDFRFAGMTTPFERHKQDAVMFEGMFIHPTRDGDQHVQGFAALWTAQTWTTGGAFKTNGPSADQYLAEKLGRMLTPAQPSIFLGVQTKNNRESACFATDGSFIVPVQSPYETYQKLFGGFMTGSAEPDPSVLERIRIRQSVLDVVAKDITAFQKRLGAEDRMRSEVQLSAIRTLEERLATAPTTKGEACTLPKHAAGLDVRDSKNYPELVRMQLENITAAFACDITRIAMFSLGGDNGHRYDPINNPADSHALSHEQRNAFVTTKRHTFSLVADWIDQLKNIPEPGPDGRPSTMLDNTLIVLGSDISGGHTHRNGPFMTLGGKNMGIRTGRYINFRAPSSRQRPDGFWDEGVPHGKLLTSVINAMGLPDTSFGNTLLGSGPLTELT